MRMQITGDEPVLGGLKRSQIIRTGDEPMLGGEQRPRLRRRLFWELLQIDRFTRLEAVEKVYQLGQARLYASAMVAVLEPGSRYYKLGHFWKVSYTYYHKLAAMDSLIRLDQELALHGLIKGLRTNNVALQQAIISSMLRLEHHRTDMALVSALTYPSRPIRTAVIQALAVRWDQPVLKRLVNPEPNVIIEAVEWLGQHESIRIVPVLKAIFDSYESPSRKSQKIHSSIIQALGEIASRSPDGTAKEIVIFFRAIIDRVDRTVDMELIEQIVRSLRQIQTDEAQATMIVYQHEYGLG